MSDPNALPPTNGATPTTNTPGTAEKKKRAPNWLPDEEAQLAVSYVNVSEQPEFAANQTSETFFRKVADDFNTYSKSHFRSWDVIRTRWGPLNTATLKFAAIYNALERNPPSGTGGTVDWLETAHATYRAQSKGASFGSVLAWQKLRHAPKWRNEGRGNDLVIPTFEISSDTLINPDAPDSSVSVSGTFTPSARAAFSIDRPTGQKAAKKRRIDNYSDMEKLAAAEELTSVAKERLLAFREGNDLVRDKNDLDRDLLKIEEKKLAVEQKKLDIEEQHRLSEVQINDLKMLRETEHDLDDQEAKDVLQMIKKKIKHKWLSTA
ncbi:hypothetical protein MJO28_010663 [Puccinia striiformis f. sp. tritici]|uniref:Uncharacterized protein n=1 Tax=Puccinia striiformis f. sp. tritici TaxID=168172 RepID=A0ACC0E588_9BASI|nr:hypothetical protein MJO28_010663 [Puccinia striiformis f. sp. tritici]